jgi:hypothetical protein
MMKKLALLVATAALFTASAFAATANPTSTVSVAVGPEAGLTINTATANLVSPQGSIFADYTGTTNFTYFIRTTQTGGSGSITLLVSSDFAPAGGPSVGSPVNGDALTYTASATAPATAATGTLTTSTSTATSVATFGAGQHSAKAGNAGFTNWDLTNDPAYTTGTYSAVVTWSISAV